MFCRSLLGQAVPALLILLALPWYGTNLARAGDKADLQAASQEGCLLRQKGAYSEAMNRYEQAVQLAEKVHGPQSPTTAHLVNNLALLYVDMGQSARAEPLYQRSLNIRESKLGPDHPVVAKSLNNLANRHAETNPWPEASAETDRGRRIVRRHVARYAGGRG